VKNVIREKLTGNEQDMGIAEWRNGQ
jgi:hypothetical protein